MASKKGRVVVIVAWDAIPYGGNPVFSFSANGSPVKSSAGPAIPRAGSFPPKLSQCQARRKPMNIQAAAANQWAPTSALSAEHHYCLAQGGRMLSSSNPRAWMTRPSFNRKNRCIPIPHPCGMTKTEQRPGVQSAVNSAVKSTISLAVKPDVNSTAPGFFLF